jgi:predicted nucleic acid-binding protein
LEQGLTARCYATAGRRRCIQPGRAAAVLRFQRRPLRGALQELGLALALEQVSAWMESPSLVVLAESSGYWRELSSLLKAGHVVGPQVHDARIAALCLHHGVSELWSADRDFSRFPRRRDPLIA